MRVPDFCSYIAGSYGPMLLAQMGADVIKIESLEGVHFGILASAFCDGTRANADPLNLASAEGREIIYRLVEQADIVVESLRPGRMRRFWLGYETIRLSESRNCVSGR